VVVEGENEVGTNEILIPDMTKRKAERGSWMVQRGMRRDLRYGACLWTLIGLAILIGGRGV
jgi:hypothetical protein